MSTILKQFITNLFSLSFSWLFCPDIIPLLITF